MTCDACEISKKRPLCGDYRMQCLDCCTRLVLSAYPLKHAAAAMLAVVRRHHGAAGRAKVSESVRQTLAKRR
jgi:hypothetical protein